MHRFDMFPIVLRHLDHFYAEPALASSTKMRKLRDLFIGIILNLVCNIEDDHLITHLLGPEINILKYLMLILRDPRSDWPTHGSSQAILNYSTLAAQNMAVYERF